MPTKRPDQLPEGEDFNFEDILMVEKFPDSESRKLYKTQLRKLMESALQMDPQRMGENAILGMQSKFDWVIEQMNKLSDNNIINVDRYEEFNSPSKEQEKPFITPSVTVTPTPSSTPPLDPSIPRPSMTPTPTPTTSSKPLTMEKQITLEGPLNRVCPMPNQHHPLSNGYNQWKIKAGQDNKNTTLFFVGFFPDNYKPNVEFEKLSIFRKIDNKHFELTTEYLDELGLTSSEQGLPPSSEITFTIIYYDE
jgi:hypothetical protein